MNRKHNGLLGESLTDEMRSTISQNDVRRTTICRQLTTCLEQSTGVKPRPNIVNLLLSFLIDSRLICSLNSCGIYDLERTLLNTSTN